MDLSTVFLLAVVSITTCGSVKIADIPRIEGRIVGGEGTTIESFPYQVSIRIFSIHICSGAIIEERVVITAAHCILQHIPASSYSIQYGTSVIGGTKNIITAERVVTHENYNSSNFNNDIALIFLVSDIELSAVAKPIKLASIAPETGNSAIISGWGALAEGGPNAPILQQVSVEIIDKSTCKGHYNHINNVTENMLCAGVIGGGKDACKDDSGGPLESDGQLVGITSFGYGCGRANYPGVYTNVALFINWINSTLAT